MGGLSVSLYLALLSAGGLSLLLSFRASRLDVAGARPFAVMMLMAGGWAFVYVLLIAAPDVGAKLAWYRLLWTFYALVPAMWFAFALEFTGIELSRRKMALLLIGPAAFALLALTNDLHGFMWSASSEDPGPIPTLGIVRAPGAWLFFGCSYVELGIANLLLMGRLWRLRSWYRAQGVALMIGVLVPTVGNLAYTFGLGPLPNLDLTPFGFTVTGTAFGLGLLRFRLLDLVPIAPRVAIRAIFESMADGVLVVDRHGHVIDLNPAAGAILDQSPDQAIGQSVSTVLPGVLDEDNLSGPATEYERSDAAEGSRHYDVRLSPLRHWSGRQAGWLVALRDVTERRRAEDVVRTSEERLRALVRSVSDVIAVLRPSGELQYLSPAAQAAWGYEPEVLLGRSVMDLIHPDDQAGFPRLISQAQEQPGMTVTMSGRLRHADESWRDFEVIVSDLTADPSVAGIVATWRDTTDRNRYERELTRLAFQDGITGLPNRTLFMDRLEHAYARAARQRTFGEGAGGRLGVLFLDLDNFKIVNDSLGHHAGDAVLVETARRLQTCLRAGDTAARLGGDEFTVLLEDLAQLDDAVAVADRITEALREPMRVADREVFLGTSIGIAVSGPAQLRPEDLLRCADLAMYEAKRRGKGRFHVFDERTLGQASDRLDLETDLRHAVERREFRVFYQPIVDLVTNQIVEVEALARWDHPERGLVSPDKFIPLSEETGLIVPIGQSVLEQACREAVEWQNAHPESSRLIVNVNLSARQFQHPTLVADIDNTLRRTGLDPRSLKLEITESVVMQDAEAAIFTLRSLKALGIHLAIDDFGTGYSSLSYLKNLPVDTLKIDRSFVDGLGQDHQDTAIVDSIIALANTLNLSVTAEGIETRAQEAHLQHRGCHHGQGYLFAKPLPAPMFKELLANWPKSDLSRAA